MKGLLPDVPMLRISSFPDAFSLLLVSQVNKCQNKVARKRLQLWRNLCLRKWSLNLLQSVPGRTDTQQYSSDKAGVLDDAGTIRHFCLQRSNWELSTGREHPRGTLLSFLFKTHCFRKNKKEGGSSKEKGAWEVQPCLSDSRLGLWALLSSESLASSDYYPERDREANRERQSLPLPYNRGYSIQCPKNLIFFFLKQRNRVLWKLISCQSFPFPRFIPMRKNN